MKYNIPIFKARASGVGKIMGEAKLGDTGMSCISDFLTEHIYGYRKDLDNKYVKNGLSGEDQAIELIARYYGHGMIFKNDQGRKENEFFTGECDIRLKKSIDDVKCSWSAYTFPRFKVDQENKIYYGQGQVYMDLEEKEDYNLHYCLVDAPEFLIDSEYWKAHRAAEYLTGKKMRDDVDEELYESIRKKMIHSHLPDEDRIKTYSFKYEPAYIKKAIIRVKECRVIIDSLI